MRPFHKHCHKLFTRTFDARHIVLLASFLAFYLLMGFVDTNAVSITSPPNPTMIQDTLNFCFQHIDTVPLP